MPANMKKAGIKYQRGGSKGGSLLKRIFGKSKPKNKKKHKSFEEKRLESRAINIRFDGTSRTGSQVRNQTRGAIKMRNDQYGLNPNSKREPQKKYHRQETDPIRQKKYSVSDWKDGNKKQDGGPIYTEKGMKVPGMRKAQSGFEGPGGGFMSRLRNEGVGSAMKGSFPARAAGVWADESAKGVRNIGAGIKNAVAGPSDGMSSDPQMDKMADFHTKKYGGSKKMYKKGGGFPDMNKDGQITQADIFLKKKEKGTIKKYGGSKKYKSGGAVGPHGIL